MVQREIADRLRAAPGSRTYGSPSVLVQLACEVELLRTVDPAVFRPRPRVESAILGLRRTGPGADPATRELVRAAFAHRRKSLARSLEHGRPGLARRRPGRRSPSSACPRTRAPRRSRPRSSPPCPRSCERRLTPPPMPSTPPPSSTSASTSARAATDGLHELCSLFEPLALADLIEVAEAERDEVVCPGVEGENLAARALAALRERGWERRAAAGRDREADPGRRRPRRRQRRRRGGPAARRRRGRRPASGSRPSSAPTCPRSSTRRWPWSAAPASGSSACPSPRRTRSSCCPAAAGSQHRRGLRRGRPARPRPRRRRSWRSWPARLREAAGAGASPLAYAELLVNDLEPAARSLRPAIGDALDALREAGAAARAAHRLRPDRGRPLRRPRRGRAAAAERLDRDDAIVCEAGRGAVRLPGERGRGQPQAAC